MKPILLGILLGGLAMHFYHVREVRAVRAEGVQRAVVAQKQAAIAAARASAKPTPPQWLRERLMESPSSLDQPGSRRFSNQR